MYMGSKLIIGMVSVLISGCVEVKPGVAVRPAAGGSQESGLTEVSIGLPDRSRLKDQVADIEEQMNAYRLVIQPESSDCTNPTNVDELAAYGTRSKLNASLRHGCAYGIRLELGKKSPDDADKELATVFFRNDELYKVSKEELTGKDILAIKLRLDLTKAGESIGLGNIGTLAGDGEEEDDGRADRSSDQSQTSLTMGEGGETGRRELQYNGSRYWINAPSTNSKTSPNGLLVLLHGSGASSYQRFIDSMATVAEANNLIPISVLAPNGSGWNEGNQDRNAAYLDDLLKNEIFKKYNIDRDRMIFCLIRRICG